MPETLLETWQRARRRDRPGLRAHRGRAERALPAARGRPAQARLGRASPTRTSTSRCATPRRRLLEGRRRASWSSAGRTSSPATGATRRRPRGAFADGWLLHRRRRRARRGGLLPHPRPAQGHGHLRRRERLPGRGRGRAARAPAVAEAAVVGVPGRALGRGVRRLRRPRAAARRPRRSSASTAAARLARFKVPETFALVAALPRSAMGKVLKDELRAPSTEVVAVSDARRASTAGRSRSAASHAPPAARGGRGRLRRARLPRRVDREDHRGGRRRAGHLLPLLRVQEGDLRRARRRPQPPRAPRDEGGGRRRGTTRLEAERLGFAAYFRFTAEHPALYRIIRQAEFVSPEILQLPLRAAHERLRRRPARGDGARRDRRRRPRGARVGADGGRRAGRHALDALGAAATSCRRRCSTSSAAIVTRMLGSGTAHVTRVGLAATAALPARALDERRRDRRGAAASPRA